MKYRYTFKSKSKENTWIKEINIIVDNEGDIQSQLANQLINYEIEEVPTNCNLIPNYSGHIQLYKSLKTNDLLQMVLKYINPLEFQESLFNYEILNLDPYYFDFFSSGEFTQYESGVKPQEYRKEYIKRCYFFEKVSCADLISKHTLLLFENNEKAGITTTFF